MEPHLKKKTQCSGLICCSEKCVDLVTTVNYVVSVFYDFSFSWIAVNCNDTLPLWHSRFGGFNDDTFTTTTGIYPPPAFHFEPLKPKVLLAPIELYFY